MENTNISLVFKDEEKKIELLNKFEPGLLKYDDKGNIQINNTIKLNVPIKTLSIKEERNFHCNTIKIENNKNEFLNSNGIIDSNLNVSKTLKNILNLEMNNSLKHEDNKLNKNESNSLHYIHSIFASFIKVSINQEDFKLNNCIKEDFENAMQKEDDKYKIKEILKIYEKYGAYIPFEFVLGGKYLTYFDAHNEKEQEEITKNLNNKTNMTFNDQKFDFGINNNNINKLNNNNENINMRMEVIGGDILKKDDFLEWYKSINTENIQIIEYKSLYPLHYYLENKELIEKIDELLEKYYIELSNEKNSKKIEDEKKKENEKKENEINDNDDKDIDEEELKILVIGDSKSGKSSILKKYTNGTFNEEYKSTIKIFKKHKNIKIKINNKKKLFITFLIEYPLPDEDNLDLEYKEKFDAIFFIFDISCENSFRKLKWEKIFNKYYKKIPIFLIPNKSDLKSFNKKQELERYCKRHNIFLSNEINCKTQDFEEFSKTINGLINYVIFEKQRKIDNEKRNFYLQQNNNKKSNNCW